jgi:GxxExxY protein
MDIVIAGQVILEVKSVEALAPIHEAQMLTHLPDQRPQGRPPDEL